MSQLIFIGDIVGESGRTGLKHALIELREEYPSACFIVNAENAAGGRGLTPKLAQEILKAGVEVITLGDHVWDQPQLAPWLATEPRVLRPFNLQGGSPGQGSCVVDTPMGKLGVVNLLGRAFIRPIANNPFEGIREELERLRDEEGATALFVDFHAEATSEKLAMGYYLDGLATAIVGTHTHVQTADARVLEKGSAYITDAGMCGSLNGVLGREAQASVDGFVSGMPTKLPVASWPVQVGGVVIELNEINGLASSITPFLNIYNQA